MNINNNIQQNSNPSFEKLYMPPRDKFAKKLSEYAANEAEKAKPELEQLAKNYDIFVSIINSGMLYGVVGIKVKEPKLSNFCKLFKKNFKVEEFVYGNEFMGYEDSAFTNKTLKKRPDMSEVITNKTKNAVKQIEVNKKNYIEQLLNEPKKPSLFEQIFTKLKNILTKS